MRIEPHGTVRKEHCCALAMQIESEGRKPHEVRSAACIQNKWLGSWWSIESGGGRADERRRSKLEYRASGDRSHLLETLRHRANEPVMQGATLVVLIMGARIVLMRLRLRVIGCSHCGYLCCIEMSVLMQDVNIDQTGHTPELRKEEQAKQPSAESLKPPEHPVVPLVRLVRHSREVSARKPTRVNDTEGTFQNPQPCYSFATRDTFAKRSGVCP
jgi:hypothetical protein